MYREIFVDFYGGLPGSTKTISLSKTSDEFDPEDLMLKLTFERNLLIGLSSNNASKSVINILGGLSKAKGDKSEIDIDFG